VEGNPVHGTKRLVAKYPVIAVADINMFPANLFQKIRKKLFGKAVVKVVKTRVMKKAISEVQGKDILKDNFSESCAAIFTDMNPFELYSLLKKSKGKIPAKVGAIAEEDIIVPAGDTGLPPGPALSDLKAAGLKVAVQGATISVVADKVVTPAGEPVSAAVAGTLSKLNIKPFKVGLKLVAAFEDGQVFDASILDIDAEKVFANFVSAHQKAFNLAFNAVIFTKDTSELLVFKAFNDAKAVALEGNIMNPVTVQPLIAKANLQAKAVKGFVKEAPVETPKEEPKEAPAEAEKKEDA